MQNEMLSSYIEGLYSKQQLTQAQYTKETELQEFGPVIADDVARMLRVLIMMKRPAKILEIGTSIGFSTVMMAKAVQSYGGKITTIEFDANVAKQAQQNFERERVADQIAIIVGDAREIIPTLIGEYDFIFQDVGDKALYAALLDDCVRLLKTGGLLVAEDTLLPVMLPSVAKWQEMRTALAEFNDKVTACRMLASTLLPIGDGLTVAVKLDK